MAAFKITFDADPLEQVFSENVWPKRCEIRDWVYTERRGPRAALAADNGIVINNPGGD